MDRPDGLYGEIHGLIGIRCHRSLRSDRLVVWTLLLESTLTDTDALAAYLRHPAYMAVNDGGCRPIWKRAQLSATKSSGYSDQGCRLQNCDLRPPQHSGRLPPTQPNLAQKASPVRCLS
jgi:hypothetical protein